MLPQKKNGNKKLANNKWKLMIRNQLSRSINNGTMMNHRKSITKNLINQSFKKTNILNKIRKSNISCSRERLLKRRNTILTCVLRTEFIL